MKAPIHALKITAPCVLRRTPFSSSLIQISMADDRFKNLQFNRNRRLAVVLFCVFFVALLVINRFTYPFFVDRRAFIPWPAPGLGREMVKLMIPALLGIIATQICLLTIWIVMAYEPFAKRIVFFLSTALALGAAWVLGFASIMDTTESLTWFETEEISASGFFPLVFLAMGLPLIALRFFGYFVIAIDDKSKSAPPTRGSISILSLIIATGIVGLVFGGIGIPLKMLTTIGMPPSEVWMAAGILSGIAFGIGLIGLLPCVLLLFSKKRSYFIWSILSWVAVGGIVGAVQAIFFRRGMDWGVMTFALTTIVLVTFGIGIMRLFGYRLTKTIRPIS